MIYNGFVGEHRLPGWSVSFDWLVRSFVCSSSCPDAGSIFVVVVMLLFAGSSNVVRAARRTTTDDRRMH